MKFDEISRRLKKYKEKYFLNRVLKSTILFACIILIISLLALTIEFFANGGTELRTLLFFSVCTTALIGFIWLILPPFLGYLHLEKFALSDEEAARKIGSHFPDIQDKLLNAIQLHKVSKGDHELMLASIEQRTAEIGRFSFSDAVNFRGNSKYLKYLATVAAVIIITGLSAPAVIFESSDRIINYRKEFKEEAPFNFLLLSDELKAFRGDDFTIKARMSGSFIPTDLYVDLDGRLIKMKKNADGAYIHTVTSLQRSINFQLSAAGFTSEQFNIEVVALPELLNFEVSLNYPDYTGIENNRVSNVGNFTVPEGTTLNWLLKSQYTDSIELVLNGERKNIKRVPNDNSTLEMASTFTRGTPYSFVLKNQDGINREKIGYQIEVIKDQFPLIEAEFYLDTVLYEYFIISGTISDDYGFSRLSAVLSGEEDRSLPIPFNSNSNNQSFYIQVGLDSISSAEETIRVFARVGDNDRVNGSKTAQSQVFTIRQPDTDAVRNVMDKKEKKTEDDLNKTIRDSKNLNKKLEELKDRLKTKKDLDWQEEKLINDILTDRKEIEKKLENLKKEYENLKAAENKFNDRSQQLQEKAENLEKIINETMNEETKKLYDELQKLLEDDEGIRQMQEQLSKITPNEQNLEKELERALELFKRLKLESKLEKTSRDLSKLGEEQKELAEKQSADEGKSPDSEDLEDQQNQDKEGGEKSSEQSSQDKQKEIKEKYEDIQKEIEEIQQMNQDLKNPEPLENTSEEQDEIQKLLEEIEKNMEENQRQQSKSKQQQSGNKMQQLGQKMQKMQMGMEMQMLSENIDQLRKVLDDLIRLSFRQEKIIDAFKEVNQIDPRYVELSQEQLKLKNDAEVIEDSLLALAERVTQISSFVTREVSEVNRNIDSALEELRQRDRNKAMSDQQFAMTSINNLALLLDDVLQSMQMSLSQSMGNPQKSKGNQSNLPDLKKLQEQLSESIKGMKKGQKQGRELSQELAEKAAQQQMIRNELKKLSDKLEGEQEGSGEKPGGNLGKIMDLMEQNEIDLVNKNITRQLIERQKDIMTRLLEAEDAMREQEMDPERKAETAQDYQAPLPPAFEKYLKEREKEIELLKSLPLEFNPFYKKEVNDYFRRLTSDN